MTTENTTLAAPGAYLQHAIKLAQRIPLEDAQTSELRFTLTKLAETLTARPAWLTDDQILHINETMWEQRGLNIRDGDAIDFARAVLAAATPAAKPGEPQPYYHQDLGYSEFLAKRVARVAKAVGVSMPARMDYEGIATVAPTILGSIALKLEQAAKEAAATAAQPDTDAAEGQEMLCVRNGALEAAAAVCDRMGKRDMHPAECAAAIRALKVSPAAATAAQPATFRVSVQPMQTSAGTDYIVAIDHPQRPADAQPWDGGRMTPSCHRNPKHAEIEAQAWREFFAHSGRKLSEVIADSIAAPAAGATGAAQ